MLTGSNGFDLEDNSLNFDDLEYTFSPKTLGADDCFSDLFANASEQQSATIDAASGQAIVASGYPLAAPALIGALKVKEEPVDDFSSPFSDLPLISNTSADDWLSNTMDMSTFLASGNSAIPPDYKDPAFAQVPSAQASLTYAPQAYYPRTRSHPASPLQPTSRSTRAGRPAKRKLENLDYCPDSARKSTEEALALLEQTIPETLEDEKELKKQRRLLKNREAAHLSRLRKKQYVEDLETQVETLTSENSAIKARLKELEMENVQLKEHIKKMSAPFAPKHSAACR